MAQQELTTLTAAIVVGDIIAHYTILALRSAKTTIQSARKRYKARRAETQRQLAFMRDMATGKNIGPAGIAYMGQLIREKGYAAVEAWQHYAELVLRCPICGEHKSQCACFAAKAGR